MQLSRLKQFAVITGAMARELITGGNGKITAVSYVDKATRTEKQVRCKAVVVAGADFDPDGLLAYCREHLASYKCPASVTVVDDLPRNATGKVLKRQLREPFWAGREATI